MKYAFLLGRNKLLSIAELRATLARDGIQYQHTDSSPLRLADNFYVIETKENIVAPQTFLDRLGGTIKIIELFDSLQSHKLAEIPSLMTALLSPHTQAPATQKKFLLGVSFYGEKFSARDVRRFGMECKKYIASSLAGRSVRFVHAQQSLALDAASIRKNNILERGADMCVIEHQDHQLIGRTIAVQNIDFYSARDYGRPWRDMNIGMMPPKLCQIIINLAGVPQGGAVLDPYCGLGTILQEGMLLGLDMYGSDIDARIVEHARENLRWIQSNLSPRTRAHAGTCDDNHLLQSNVRDIASRFSGKKFDAIVTESDLGPIFSRLPHNTEIDQLSASIERTSHVAFQQYTSLLQPGGKVVTAFPYYQPREKKLGPITVISDEFLDILEKLGYDRLSYISPDEIPDMFLRAHITRRKSLLYGRPNQIVGREIFVFQKH